MNDTQQNHLQTCFEALATGENKEIAYKNAQLAYAMWKNLDLSDKGLSDEELVNIRNVRSIALASVSSVFVWNHDFQSAYEIENEFLWNKSLHSDENRSVIDIYLMQLIIQNQLDHLGEIFRSEDLQQTFLVFNDIYHTILDRSHQVESDEPIFVHHVDMVNGYSRMFTGEKVI